MPNDYTTALYYTFSTIPQTLAGLLGVLGAFIVFQLQQLRESCSHAMSMIHQDVPEDASPEVHQAYWQEDWEIFLALVEQSHFQLMTSAHQGAYHIEPAKKKLKHLKDTQRSLIILLSFGALINDRLSYTFGTCFFYWHPWRDKYCFNGYRCVCCSFLHSRHTIITSEDLS